MKSVLITGGAGFFGGILKRSLLEQGVNCVTVDLLPDPDTHPRLSSHQVDIRDAVSLSNVFRAHRFDAVFHCAAVLAHGSADPKFLWTSNVDGTEVVARTAVDFGVPSMVYTSSNCLWGRGLDHAIAEDEPPCPVELYGRSKLEGERILERYAAKLNISTVRCPTIIDSGRLGLLTIVYDFIRENRTVWTVGGGHNRYQFIYAADLADACVRMAQHNRSDVFCIGSDHVKSLRDVYLSVIELAGSRSKVGSLPKGPTLAAMQVLYRLGMSPLGPYHYKMISENSILDTSKIKRDLGWRPTLTNEQMLFRGYQYYVSNFDEIHSRKQASTHRQAANMGAIRVLKWVS